MTPEDAIAKRRAMHAATDPTDVLYADVCERLAIRDPPWEWEVHQYDRAVRLFRITDAGPVSQYVWRWRSVDDVIDRLLAATPQRTKPPAAE